jgi:hypothetical protein
MIIIITTNSFMQGIYPYIPDKQTLSLTTQCHSHSVYGAQYTSCCVGSNALIHQHFQQSVCSAQYGSFL